MTFKSFGFGVVLAGAVATGALVAAPAQAASLAPGSFRIISDSNITGLSSGGGTTSFNLDFISPTIDPDPIALQGVFTGLTAGVGGPTVQSLAFSGPTAGNTFSNVGLPSFIRNIFLGADEVFVDLDPFSVINTTGGALTSNLYNLTGGFTGRVRDSLGNVLGIGNLSSLKIGSNNQTEIDVATVAIPTPALLPGLIGMGVATLRRRKSVKETATVANS